MHHSKHRFLQLIGTVSAALALLACGGGGGTDPGTLHGLVATGAVLPNAHVSAKCLTGPTITGSADAAGVFNISLTSAHTAPCLLEATGTPAGSSTSVTLHGFATGAGLVNITPISELVVANALGNTSTPGTAFASMNATVATRIAGNLATAKTYVQTQVTAIVGSYLTADPLSGAFAVGDASDKILDKLVAAIKAAPGGKTLADLSAAAGSATTLTTVVPAPSAGSTTCPAGQTLNPLMQCVATSSGGTNGGTPGSAGATTPSISGFTPATAAIGTTVTISGTNLGNFTPAPVVRFGTTTATVSSATSTSVVVTVPSGLAAGNSTITMSNFDGTGAVTVGTFTVSATGGGTGTGATGTASNGTPNVAVANCNKRIPTGDLVLYTGCSAGAVAPFANITVTDTLSGSGKTCTASYANGMLTATDGTLSGSQPMDGSSNASISNYATNNVDSTIQIMQASTIVGTTAPIVRVSWNAAGKPFAIQFGSTSVGGVYQIVNCMTTP